jgi:hypothetical protein
VQHVAVASPSAERAVAKKSLLPPVATDKVAETVDTAVDTVKDVQSKAASVQACLGPADVLNVSVDVPDRTRLAHLLTRIVPEPLRFIGEKTCAPKAPDVREP